MYKTKYRFHAFAVYDPNNLDTNKDSHNIPVCIHVDYFSC